ncbi:hypothetical protein B0H10DRAFT_2189191 [Mycena sp. CBHHK59/15]|nr:hypothetical protein B0H10DRAFT_2189191 [Mycena sp. CBHHK59/15]
MGYMEVDCISTSFFIYLIASEADAEYFIGVAKKCCPTCLHLASVLAEEHNVKLGLPGRDTNYHPWHAPAWLSKKVLQRLELNLRGVVQDMVTKTAGLSHSRGSTADPLSDDWDDTKLNRREYRELTSYVVEVLRKALCRRASFIKEVAEIAVQWILPRRRPLSFVISRERLTVLQNNWLDYNCKERKIFVAELRSDEEKKNSRLDAGFKAKVASAQAIEAVVAILQSQAVLAMYAGEIPRCAGGVVVRVVGVLACYDSTSDTPISIRARRADPESQSDNGAPLHSTVTAAVPIPVGAWILVCRTPLSQSQPAVSQSHSEATRSAHHNGPQSSAASRPIRPRRSPPHPAPRLSSSGRPRPPSRVRPIAAFAVVPRVGRRGGLAASRTPPESKPAQCAAKSSASAQRADRGASQRLNLKGARASKGRTPRGHSGRSARNAMHGPPSAQDSESGEECAPQCSRSARARVAGGATVGSAERAIARTSSRFPMIRKPPRRLSLSFMIVDTSGLVPPVARPCD